MNVDYENSSKRSNFKTFFSYLYFTLTGFITIPLTFWFASGTIAESQTAFPAPGFFVFTVIWGLGLAINLRSKFYWISILISFLPVVYFTYLFVYPFFM